MIRFFADRKMDPDAVKSTLSNLAFGNVIAAAARDYKKVWSLKLSSFFIFSNGFLSKPSHMSLLTVGSLFI
jgi:hypothetical protein